MLILLFAIAPVVAIGAGLDEDVHKKLHQRALPRARLSTDPIELLLVRLQPIRERAPERKLGREYPFDCVLVRDLDSIGPLVHGAEIESLDKLGPLPGPLVTILIVLNTPESLGGLVYVFIRHRCDLVAYYPLGPVHNVCCVRLDRLNSFVTALDQL